MANITRSLAITAILILSLTACNPTLRYYSCDNYYEHGEVSEVDLGERLSGPTAEDRARIVSELGSAINSRKEDIQNDESD